MVLAMVQRLLGVPSPPRTSLLTLPNELLLKIAYSTSTIGDLSSLHRANRRLFHLLAPIAPTCACPSLYPRVTPLHHAASHGHTRLLRHLLHDSAALATLNQASSRGTTPLAAAVIFKQQSAIRQLLAAGANPNRRRRGIWNATALHLAVLSGNLAIVEQLCGAGADVNAVLRSDRLCISAFHLAVLAGHVEVARMLARNGARRGDDSPLKKGALAVVLGRWRGMWWVVDEMGEGWPSLKGQGLARLMYQGREVVVAIREFKVSLSVVREVVGQRCASAPPEPEHYVVRFERRRSELDRIFENVGNAYRTVLAEMRTGGKEG